ARLAAVKEAGAEHETVTDPDAIGRAEREMATLRTRRYLNRPIRSSEFLLAVQALSDALRRNCSELIRLKPPFDEGVYRAARKLDDLHHEMTETLAPYAIDIAQQREA